MSLSRKVDTGQRAKPFAEGKGWLLDSRGGERFKTRKRSEVQTSAAHQPTSPSGSDHVVAGVRSEWGALPFPYPRTKDPDGELPPRRRSAALAGAGRRLACVGSRSRRRCTHAPIRDSTRPLASEGRHGGDVCPTSRVDRPRRHCTCGLYAAASQDYLARSGVTRIGSSVVGTVSMWGRVIEHTRGARSRFAYPARLRLVCEPCLALGAGAVTPVRVLGDHGRSRPSAGSTGPVQRLARTRPPTSRRNSCPRTAWSCCRSNGSREVSAPGRSGSHGHPPPLPRRSRPGPRTGLAVHGRLVLRRSCHQHPHASGRRRVSIPNRRDIVTSRCGFAGRIQSTRGQGAGPNPTVTPGTPVASHSVPHMRKCSSEASAYLPDTEEVRGSNPLAPTTDPSIARCVITGQLNGGSGCANHRLLCRVKTVCHHPLPWGDRHAADRFSACWRGCFPS